MVVIAPSALDRLLASVELRLDSARQVALAEAELLPLAPTESALVYVTSGVLLGGVELSAGDAFLTTGRDPLLFEAGAGTEIMLANFHLADSPLVAALPRQLWVHDFRGIENSAATLAATLGLQTEAKLCGVRLGDPVLCAMMVTTVLLALVRSWAATECAPAGWPSPERDPFLARAIAQVHDDPGRKWTVELLATVSAMSRTVFTERFRSEIGASPASYVARVRMDEAKRMLQSGRSVSDTARKLGYASDEGFRRAFRRHTGHTPSSWLIAQAA